MKSLSSLLSIFYAVHAINYIKFNL